MSDGDLSAVLTVLSIPLGGLIAAAILAAILRWRDRKAARKCQKP